MNAAPIAESPFVAGAVPAARRKADRSTAAVIDSIITENPVAAEKRRSLVRSISEEDAAAFLKKRSLDFEEVPEGSVDAVEGPI